MRLLFAIATVCTAATLVACGSGTSSTKTPTATVTAASSSPTRVASPSASASTATVAIAATEAPPATSAATIAAEPTVAPPPVVAPTDAAPPPATATDVPPPSSSTFTVVGQNLLFNLTQLNAAAGAPVTIVFDNEDSAVAHNIHFFSGASSSGTSVGATDIIAGPSTATLSLGVLAAGSYFYHCDVHPVQMQGHLTVS